MNKQEEKSLTIDNYLDSHFIHRSNWLRAVFLVQMMV